MEPFGSSDYGKMATDKDQHSEVKYGNDIDASCLVNDKCFRELHPPDNEFYEVDLMEKHIEYDLPLQITIFMYKYTNCVLSSTSMIVWTTYMYKSGHGSLLRHRDE